MTTPAINRDSVSFRPGHVTLVNWNTTVGNFPPDTSVFRNVNKLWESELRPASGTSPPEGKYGWRPCRAWNHSGRNYFYPPSVVNHSIDYGTYGSRYRYDDGSFWGVNPPDVPSFPSGLINQAEVKALNKLKQQDVNLGQFLAEFDQVERMVGHHFVTIAKSVRRFRAGHPPRIWKRIKAFEHGNGVTNADLKKIPPAWLELQYGWRPLLSDIYGAIQFLGRPGRDPLVHVKGYAESETAVTVPCSSVTSDSFAQIQFSCRQRCWVSLYYMLTSPGLATQSSLGLLNPAEIVWECLPYSFVVDWAIPIGPWMSSLTADAGFTFKGGSRSTMSEMGDGSLYSVSFVDKTQGGAKITANGQGPTLTGKAYDFKRVCYLESPVPGLYVKNPLSATHVANAIALLIQSFA